MEKFIYENIQKYRHVDSASSSFAPNSRTTVVGMALRRHLYLLPIAERNSLTQPVRTHLLPGLCGGAYHIPVRIVCTSYLPLIATNCFLAALRQLASENLSAQLPLVRFRFGFRSVL